MKHAIIDSRDVEGASRDNGARVLKWSPGGGVNQIFDLKGNGDGFYRIVAMHSGKVLALSGASADAVPD